MKNKKIKKFKKFSLHPLFIIIVLLSIFTGNGLTMLVFTISVLVHELAHMLMARTLGYTCLRVKLMPYGAVLDGSFDEFNTTDEVKVALAGPCANLVLFILCVCSWWIFPVGYGYSLQFAISNVVLFIFNLFPFFPLDGGRVFLAILSSHLDRIQSVKIVKYTTITFSICLFIIFILSLFFTINLSFGIMSISLLISAFSEDKHASYVKLITLSSKFKKLKKGLKVVSVMVSDEATDLDIYKLLRSSDYKIFLFTSASTMKVVKTVTETELLSRMTKM